MDRIRKKVLETLSALPGTLEAHHSYLELYRQDEGLLGKAEELYIAILTGVEGMIEWLDHSTYSKGYLQSFKQRTLQLLTLGRGGLKGLLPARKICRAFGTADYNQYTR